MQENDQFCPICATRINPCFRKRVLGKYHVEYFECPACGLVKTEHPHWLEEAYASAIADMDTGLVQRNIEMSKTTSRIIAANFDPKGVFLDYAGGYGLFVRLMRDKGFDFYWRDIFCENIFARHFQMPQSEKSFELVTAFEVFEHIADPIIQMREISEISLNILITTHIRPEGVDEMENWWYLVPETGQHVTFYSLRSLEVLAYQLDLHFYSNRCNLHLFSKNVLNEPFSCLTNLHKRWFTRVTDRLRGKQKIGQQELLLKEVESLTWTDHLRVRDNLRKTQK